jgi:hypothetical protein
MLLFQFLTTEVTHEGDNHGASCIQTNWKHKDPGAMEELQGWYFELLAQQAWLPSQPEPIVVAPPAAPMGTPPISPHSVIQLANLLGAHYCPPAPTEMVPATPAKKYNQYKIIIWQGYVVLQGHPETWRDLQVEALPDFWVQIRSIRGQNSHLRAFVEGYIEESTKDSPWEYSFLLTTKMLNILQGLGFAGEDAEKKWQNRMKGLSLWSLAPQQNKATHQVGNKQCQRMIDFEDMALNHCPGDRVENSCIVQPDPAPMDHMALFWWVDHAAILLTVYFGEDCPLVTSRLHPLAKVLQSRKHFHNYTMTHWVALTWRIHLNVRAFFEEKGVGMAAVSVIRCTTVDIGSGMRYGEDILPLDFPKPHATKHQGRDSTPTGRNRAPRPDGAPPAPKRPKGVAMFARFCPLVNQAADR